MQKLQLLINGDWVDGEGASRTVTDKFSGDVLGSFAEASRDQVSQALRGLEAVREGSPLSPRERSVALRKTAALVAERSKEFVNSLVSEGGFPMRDAEREVSRTVQTLELCAAEAERIGGEVIPIEASVRLGERVAYTIRVPIGIVCAITPFNSPLNTVVHKVGPALAAGNSVILKPSTYTPLTAQLLVRALIDGGIPSTRLALVLGGGSTVGQWLLEDQGPDFYAFTGGTGVGELIHATVGLRPAQLELGSLSSTFLCSDADLDDAIPKCVDSAFRKAGQICTSIQRLYVESSIVDEVCARMLAIVRERPVGDPRESTTFVGPMIAESEAIRVEKWIADAVAGGAKILTGGTRERSVVQPTVLTDVSTQMSVMCEEVFGPVVCIRPFSNFADAVAEANDTPFGLAAGVFTKNIDRAMFAMNKIQVGSVHINETSNGRLDVMPYHGVKMSGLGMEGPRFAIKEMSQERLVTIRSVEAASLQ